MCIQCVSLMTSTGSEFGYKYIISVYPDIILSDDVDTRQDTYDYEHPSIDTRIRKNTVQYSILQDTLGYTKDALGYSHSLRVG